MSHCDALMFGSWQLSLDALLKGPMTTCLCSSFLGTVSSYNSGCSVLSRSTTKCGLFWMAALSEASDRRRTIYRLSTTLPTTPSALEAAR